MGWIYSDFTFWKILYDLGFFGEDLRRLASSTVATLLRNMKYGGEYISFRGKARAWYIGLALGYGIYWMRFFRYSKSLESLESPLEPPEPPKGGRINLFLVLARAASCNFDQEEMLYVHSLTVK